jgi:hypothetical protein
MSVVTIQNELLNLPATERARLIDVLWESLSEPELKLREAAWAVESEQRNDQVEGFGFSAALRWKTRYF